MLGIVPFQVVNEKESVRRITKKLLVVVGPLARAHSEDLKELSDGDDLLISPAPRPLSSDYKPCLRRRITMRSADETAIEYRMGKIRRGNGSSNTVELDIFDRRCGLSDVPELTKRVINENLWR